MPIEVPFLPVHEPNHTPRLRRSRIHGMALRQFVEALTCRQAL